MFRREGTRELLLGRIGARQNIYDTGTKGRSPSKEAFVRVRTGMREFIKPRIRKADGPLAI